MKNKVNYLFLFGGMFSITLAVFDFSLEHDLFGGSLALTWGLFFIFLSLKKDIEIRAGGTMTSFLQVFLIILIVASGLLKLFFKLKIISI